MPLILLALAGLWFFEVWPFSVGAPLDFQTEYMPEVGYRSGEETIWFVGERMSDKSECYDEAVYSSRRLANADPSRVVSIACRVMRGDRFLDRSR